MTPNLNTLLDEHSYAQIDDILFVFYTYLIYIFQIVFDKQTNHILRLSAISDK